MFIRCEASWHDQEGLHIRGPFLLVAREPDRRDELVLRAIIRNVRLDGDGEHMRGRLKIATPEGEFDLPLEGDFGNRGQPYCLGRPRQDMRGLWKYLHPIEQPIHNSLCFGFLDGEYQNIRLKQWARICYARLRELNLSWQEPSTPISTEF